MFVTQKLVHEPNQPSTTVSSSLNHHKRELNRVRAGQPEDPAKEEAWDQKNAHTRRMGHGPGIIRQAF